MPKIQGKGKSGEEWIKGVLFPGYRSVIVPEGRWPEMPFSFVLADMEGKNKNTKPQYRTQSFNFPRAGWEQQLP
jgi:hypothetical protein